MMSKSPMPGVPRSPTSGGSPALSPLGPRRRWWRHALLQLQQAAANPVKVHLSAEYRVVEVMKVYGLRIESATGRLTGLEFELQDGQTRSHDMRYPNVSLTSSPASSEVLRRFTQRNAMAWASAADAAALEPETIRILVWRLTRIVWAVWQKDGTLGCLRQCVADAFQLDSLVVRIARQIAAVPGRPDLTTEGVYNRVLADRRAFSILDREAPQLIPLFAELMAAGQCTDEPKRALRRALLDRLGAPRHWRRYLVIPAETLGWARTAPEQPFAGCLTDLATLIARIDSPITPPLDWLQAHLHSCGGAHLMVGMDHQTRLRAVRAHVAAWVQADMQAKDQLLIELQIVHDWIDSQNPKAPQGLRNWSWWIRHALVWDQARRRAASAERGSGANAEAQAWVMDDIEFRPILSAVDAYEEARAMANCLDRWRDLIVAGQAIAWSVRDRSTGRRIATAGARDIADRCVQVKGFANQPLPPELDLRLSSEAMALQRRRLNKPMGDVTLPDESSKTGTAPDFDGCEDAEPQLCGGLILRPSLFDQRVTDYEGGGSLVWD